MVFKIICLTFLISVAPVQLIFIALLDLTNESNHRMRMMSFDVTFNVRPARKPHYQQLVM